ncbi:hypothetical protein [Streptomyces mayonensis]|uniref:hypothetical protein n=1 Tax=Streptomyces mayonensis TaxID=2750816 RepID=UPI001C1DF844|nr:hypothetical protein [Streptomyces sp. A108]MBU6529803.1 hypothetical protein [Streptomyces sp. A108]
MALAARLPTERRPAPAPVAVGTNPAPTTDVAELLLLLLADGLTPRARDVLKRVVAGLPSRAIATELHSTVSTVQDI